MNKKKYYFLFFYRYIFVLITFFIGTPIIAANAENSAQQNKQITNRPKLSGDALTYTRDSHSFIGQLKSGFHFNAKAPNLITVDGQNLKPAQLTAQKIKFQWPKIKAKSAVAQIYICDDANTFCEPKTIELLKDQTPLKSNALKKTSAEYSPHGFIKDNFLKAQELAKKENKLILVDFAARWCPGCVRLENEVFTAKEFKTSSKPFIKLKIDFDRFENLELAKKYNVKFIPTLIVLTSEGDEVSRIVDYQPLSTVKNFLSSSQENPRSIAQLLQEAKTASGSEAQKTLGLRLFQQGDYSESVKYLTKLKPEPIEFKEAQIQNAILLLENKNIKKAEFVKTVQDLISQEPKSSRSIAWRVYLIENLTEPEEKEKVAREGLLLADELLSLKPLPVDRLAGDLIGEYTGFETLLIASRRVDLIEAAGLNESEVKLAQVRVTEVGKDLKISRLQSGPSLRYLIFLIAAEKWPEAESLARTLLKNDPKNPELMRRLLRVLNGAQKYNEAIPLGRNTLMLSYGKNEVWVALQLAKAYKGAGQINEAKALSQTYLSRNDVNWVKMSKEQKEFQAFNEL